MRVFLAEPYQHAACFGVYRGHALDLVRSFFQILLVYTDRIGPYDPLNEGISEARQGLVKTRRDGQLAVVNTDELRALRVPPHVAQGFERMAGVPGDQNGAVEERALDRRVLVPMGN